MLLSSRPSDLLRRFARERGGNFVVMFALLMLPMLGLMGLGIDYALMQKTKTGLDASTDAAVLAAVTTAEQIIQSQSTANYDATDVAVTYGKIAGQMVFTANSATLKMISPPPLTLNLQRQGQKLIANASYTVQQSTMLGKLFGVNTMNAKGAAASTLTLPSFKNIYIAVDISQSMGIAATQDAMTQLASKTGGCVFGCHVATGGQTTTNEQIAENNGIPLRIDVIRTAVKNIISSAKTNASGTPLTSIGLYSIQYDLTTIKSMTTDYDGLTQSANGLDLGWNDSSGIGDSNFATSLASLANIVPASGDGSSSNSPQVYVFIMTDAVSDVRGNCGYGHCTGAFDRSLCDTFKSKGVTVGVIYTTYTPFPSEQTYRDLVQPFQPSLAPNMQACANAGFYYEAEDGPDIIAAAQQLTAQTLGQGTLTQ